jgi:hypothetical protein
MQHAFDHIAKLVVQEIRLVCDVKQIFCTRVYFGMVSFPNGRKEIEQCLSQWKYEEWIGKPCKGVSSRRSENTVNNNNFHYDVNAQIVQDKICQDERRRQEQSSLAVVVIALQDRLVGIKPRSGMNE